MSDEDKKYLRFEKNTRPSMEVFQTMVGILAAVQEKTDQLLNTLNNSLLKTSKII